VSLAALRDAMRRWWGWRVRKQQKQKRNVATDINDAKKALFLVLPHLSKTPLLSGSGSLLITEGSVLRASLLCAVVLLLRISAAAAPQKDLHSFSALFIFSAGSVETASVDDATNNNQPFGAASCRHRLRGCIVDCDRRKSKQAKQQADVMTISLVSFLSAPFPFVFFFCCREQTNKSWLPLKLPRFAPLRTHMCLFCVFICLFDATADWHELAAAAEHFIIFFPVVCII
jgi:hypothetical protein